MSMGFRGDENALKLNSGDLINLFIYSEYNSLNKLQITELYTSKKIIYLAVPGLSREKAMAPHSSTLAWKIPWTEEPGRFQSMGSLRVEHD